MSERKSDPDRDDSERAFFGRRKGHKLRQHQAELIDHLLPRLALAIDSEAPADAREIFAPAADDLPRAGLLRYPDGTPAPDAADWPLATLLSGRGIAPVSYAEWLRIETAETDLAKALGRGERVKLHNREAIWSACRPPRA